ncbi:AMIN domain-containing protein [Mailhella sp.]|uniref:AMIN domain-containing protein n=1 Tax=Mailhella sp. TaxID=1981029 RepID=UPI004063A478
MKRAPRLCAYAVAMLAVAVLACAALRDEEPVRKGSLEVSGRIAAEEARASGTPASPAPRPAPAEKSSAASVPSVLAERVSSETKNHGGDEPVRVKALSLARAAASQNALPASLDEGGRPALAAEQGTAAAPKKDTVSAASAPESVPAVKPAENVAAKTAAAVPPSQKAESKAPAKADSAQPRTEKKADAAKPVSKPAPKAAPARRTESPVEAALADARAGRLAPSVGMVIEKPAARYERVITSAKYAMKGSLIKLVLHGNAPMVGNFYVLTEPDRVVLDLAGNWEVELPKVPSNRLIAAARVGQHDDKTRLVFDMKNTGKVALVPLNRNALELRIQ